MPKLSICIPVFNQNVTTLLTDLIAQRDNLNEKVEILVFEDGSVERVKKHNFWLRKVKNLIYVDFNDNVGRSAIRNKLGQAASGEFLLFLDDDSLIENANFLKTYLQNLNPTEVLCGGRIYPKTVPAEDYSLHWTYGREAESKNAEQRTLAPHDAFHSNNFIVPRSIFMRRPFDEQLREYGHEDTMFGYTLRKHNVPVKHIDNPVIHSKLENNQEFLEKSQLALKNLYSLYLRKDKDFIKSVKILRVFEKLKKLRLTPLVAAIYRITCTPLEQSLLYANNPSLVIFNFYKLGYLINYSLQKNFKEVPHL